MIPKLNLCFVMIKINSFKFSTVHKVHIFVFLFIKIFYEHLLKIFSFRRVKSSQKNLNFGVDRLLSGGEGAAKSEDTGKIQSTTLSSVLRNYS